MSAGGTGDLQFGYDILVDTDNKESNQDRLKQVPNLLRMSKYPIAYLP